MSLDFKSEGNKFKKNSKLYLTSFFAFGLLFIVIYISGGKIYTNINKILNDTKQVTSDISLLEQKVSSLKNINKETTSSLVDSLEIAFPYEDPSLFMYSEVKALAQKHSLIIGDMNFELGNTATENVSISGLTFSVKGKRESVVNFIRELSDTAPLSGLGNITFTTYAKKDADFKVNMSVDAYYSPLPVSLPGKSNATRSLTDSEKQQAESLAKLNVLSKIVTGEGMSYDDNINPFSGLVATGSGTKE